VALNNKFLNNSAVSNRLGFKNFVRVCDNTTGSHIQGKKNHTES